VFARVTSFRGDPGYIDEGSNYIRESVLPNVGPEKGLRGSTTSSIAKAAWPSS
jgi:hypothetical protein